MATAQECASEGPCVGGDVRCDIQSGLFEVDDSRSLNELIFFSFFKKLPFICLYLDELLNPSSLSFPPVEGGK